MTRTDGLPTSCPKCGTPTGWHAPTYHVWFGTETLTLRCRCGYVMTCKPNDALRARPSNETEAGEP